MQKEKDLKMAQYFSMKGDIQKMNIVRERISIIEQELEGWFIK